MFVRSILHLNYPHCGRIRNRQTDENRQIRRKRQDLNPLRGPFRTNRHLSVRVENILNKKYTTLSLSAIHLLQYNCKLVGKERIENVVVGEVFYVDGSWMSQPSPQSEEQQQTQTSLQLNL